MNAQVAKCKCQHCNQKIEFDSDSAGATVTCPGCGMDTLLFIPPVAPRPMPAAQPEYSADKKNVAIVFAIIFLITVLAFVGAVADKEDDVSPALVLLFGLCGGVLYFIPALVGSKKRQFPALFALNLLLGWTFIGWVGALVWALIKDSKPSE
jgi:DNA-directed RNA polymerase subunit RPC12/RpoP